MTDAELHSTTDASVWTDEFLRIWRELYPGQPEPDGGWILGWLANAICVGHDHAMRDASADLARVRSQRDRLREALTHACEAFEKLKPSGHSGDEDSCQCDEDCPMCWWDGGVEHANYVLDEIAKEEP
jgi:hypothetical protein